MKKINYALWIAPVLAVSGFAVVLATVAAGDKDYPVAAPVAQPAKSPFADNISGAGLVEASTQNIAVSAALSGVVTRVYVQAGDRVPSGAPLFALDDRPLRAEIDNRKAAVQVAEARITEAEAAWQDAQAQYSKVRDIADPRAVSREETTRRETAARGAESRLKSLLATQPDLPYLNFALGNLYAGQNRWDEAQSAFFKAYAGEPENPDILFNLAISLDRLHQPRLARHYYSLALVAAEARPSSFDKAQINTRLRELQ